MLRRAVRQLLRLSARASPRGPETVIIVLMSAWGMGGTIRAAHNLAGHLAERGWNVRILSVFRSRDEPFFGSFPAGVEVIALDDRRRGAPPLLRRLPSVLVHPVEDSRNWNLWVDLQLVRRLRRARGILVTTRPSLNLIAADLSPPGLVTVGLEQVNLATWSSRLRDAMARLYPRLDALVTLTEEDRRAYADLLPPRLERIPNTVRPMGGPDPDLTAPVVIAAGRLAHQKGFDLLVEAFADVGRPGWTLRIFGKGEQKAQLEAMIEARGLGDRIELAGAASDLGAELAKASIFVLSSRREGYPLVLLEAMSKGLAVVAFDCPTGPHDIVADHVNGLLVPPEDTARLTAAVRALIDDEPLRRRLGAVAARTAAEHGMEAIGPRWEALFAELLDARGRVGPRS